jgi:mono/diheme cytochrome c family protein
MGKKEAEKFCIECHAPEGVFPLPEGHPPKYRCLFCHKRD